MAGRTSWSSSICFSATGRASGMMASGSMSLGLTRNRPFLALVRCTS